MKFMKNLLAITVLFGAVSIIGATSEVFADDEGGVPKCNCRTVNGETVWGRIVGEECLPNPCWIEIQ